MSSSIFVITDFKIIFEIDNNGDNMKRFIEKVIKQGTKIHQELKKDCIELEYIYNCYII
ncbi:MAG: hypothetical protein KIC73_17715 [Clostridiales bacterium]|uniref:hypothetical protein n=1 Tax=Clostridium sp. 12(A) TaxID=1163671 RepID=UPI0012DE0174|nr:hypothetical protein [Clostridium sp. 12(A)]MBS5958734.1 hypothetical protein [Clostridiales bacterium]